MAPGGTRHSNLLTCFCPFTLPTSTGECVNLTYPLFFSACPASFSQCSLQSTFLPPVPLLVRALGPPPLCFYPVLVSPFPAPLTDLLHGCSMHRACFCPSVAWYS